MGLLILLQKEYNAQNGSYHEYEIQNIAYLVLVHHSLSSVLNLLKI